MPTKYYTLSKSIEALRQAIGKNDIPANWLEMFLLVADSGDTGILAMELVEKTDVEQNTASRVIKHLSRFYDPKTEKSAGYDVFVTAKDFRNPRAMRVFLSEHGKEVASGLAANLN